MKQYPTPEELKALVQSGELTDGYRMVAAGYAWLVEQGARFWVNGYEIIFSFPGVCDLCAQSMPYEDWKTNYYVDIIYPNIVSNDN